MTNLYRLFFSVLFCFVGNAFAGAPDLQTALAQLNNRHVMTTDLSADGNTAVFSAIDIENDRTSIVIFEKNQDSWEQVAEIFPPEIAFALSIQISGDGNTIAIPSFLADEKAGAVYTYTRNGQQWTFQSKITAADHILGEREYFGSIVSLSYDGQVMLVTKKPKDPNYGQLPVYIFQRHNGMWVLQQKLFSIGNQDAFITAAMTDDASRIAVSTQDDRAVDIYTKQGNMWVKTQQISSDGGFPDQEIFLTLSNQHLLINVINSSEDQEAENFLDALNVTSNTTTLYEWQNTIFDNPKTFDSSFGWGAIRDDLLALPTQSGIAVYQHRSGEWQLADTVRSCQSTCLTLLPIITQEKQIVFSKIIENELNAADETPSETETGDAMLLKGGNIATPRLLINATNMARPVPAVSGTSLFLLVLLLVVGVALTRITANPRPK